MGWLFTEGLSRRDLVAERIRRWQNTQPDGTNMTSECIAHCYRGNPFSGVLWTVWERTFIKNGVQVRPAERWIGCDVLQYQGGAWGYKDMEEIMGPYCYSCPLGYLDLVPVVANAEWREGVRAYHQRQKTKRAARLAPGM